MSEPCQFRKSVKQLVLYEFEKIRSQAFRFKAGLFSTVTLVVVFSVVSSSIIGGLVDFHAKLWDSIQGVRDLQLYTHSLSYYVRAIHLIDQELMLPTNRTTYFNWIEEDAQDMNLVLNNLFKNFRVLTKKETNYFLSEKLEIWILGNGRVKNIPNNLFDTLSNIIVQGLVLKNNYNTTQIDLENKRAFFLYRNGIGEVLHKLNQSSKIYLETATQGIQYKHFYVVCLLSLSGVALCACAGFAILPSIRNINKSRTEAYKVLLEVPNCACSFMKSLYNERLETISQSNWNPENQRENFGAKLPNDPFNKKLIYLKLAVFLVITLFFFYLSYYTGFKTLSKVLSQAPYQLDWSGRRRLLSSSVNLWLMEAQIQNTTTGWKYVVPQGQTIGSPAQKAKQAISELEFMQRKLIFSVAEETDSFRGLMSQEHNKLMLENACSGKNYRGDSSCESVGNNLMSQGLYSAISMYSMIAKSAFGEITTNSQPEKVLLLKELGEKYLYDSLKKSSDLYLKDYKERIFELKTLQNIVIWLYFGLILLLYIVLYKPMINELAFETCAVWSMSSLIPQEYQEDCTKLLCAIKARKNKFPLKLS